MSSEGLYPGLENATPDWVWTASLTKPVQRCQTLLRYLEILKVGLNVIVISMGSSGDFEEFSIYCETGSGLSQDK